MYRVQLSSEVFGTEYFHYDTEREALAGFKRLRNSAERYTVMDGIKREVCYQGPVKQED